MCCFRDLIIKTGQKLWGWQNLGTFSKPYDFPIKKQWKGDHEHPQPASKNVCFQTERKESWVPSPSTSFCYFLCFAPSRLLNPSLYDGWWVRVLAEVGEVSLPLRSSHSILYLFAVCCLKCLNELYKHLGACSKSDQTNTSNYIVATCVSTFISQWSVTYHLVVLSDGGENTGERFLQCLVLEWLRFPDLFAEQSGPQILWFHVLRLGAPLFSLLLSSALWTEGYQSTPCWSPYDQPLSKLE